MKKKKRATAKIYNRLSFWLGVMVLGILVGVSIQFGRAWVEPSSMNPPEGNIAAPINTGAGKQLKTGTASNPADICVDKFGNGDEKCLGDLVTFPACTMAGGMPITVGSTTICKFPGASCHDTEVNGAVVHWIQYLNYTETTAQTCTGAGGCGTSATSGSHFFDNIDPATEAKPYYSGEIRNVTCGCDSDSVCSYYVYQNWGSGWHWGCAGYNPPVCWNCDTCVKSDIPSTCNSNVTQVGCVPN
ncbi:MAG: hypothetical protein WC831_03500 [Parcubacteria group bacterium]|jgi:hypothetical protein